MFIRAIHLDYELDHYKILAELDYKVLGKDSLKGAPGWGQDIQYPPKMTHQPHWYKPVGRLSFTDYKVWAWLEAAKASGAPISKEADIWYKYLASEDLKQEAMELLGIFRVKNQKEFNEIENAEYNAGPPNTKTINTVIFDIPEGIHYKYLNNTLKDSSYIPHTIRGDRLWKKYIKIYLEEHLEEF